MCGMQAPLMDVVLNAMAALDVNRDDEDLAFHGLTLLAWLAQDPDNQVASQLIRLYVSS